MLVYVTDYQHCTKTQDRRLEGPETGSTVPSYVSDMVEISHGLRSYGVYFYVLIPLDFHRLRIKVARLIPTLQSSQL